jgi:hypothetical protein
MSVDAELLQSTLLRPRPQHDASQPDRARSEQWVDDFGIEKRECFVPTALWSSLRFSELSRLAQLVDVETPDKG